MSDCQFKSRLDAYHDGELDAVEMERISRHLAECESCAADVARLGELSRSIGMAIEQPSPISQIELARLHRNLDAADDRSLVRLSTTLATLAASVLIISLTWITQTPGMASHPGGATRPLKDWERMAMGEPPRAPVMNNNLGVPDTGVAIRDRDTINWILDGIH